MAGIDMAGGAYSGIVGGAMSLIGGLFSGHNQAPELNQVHLDPATKGQDLFLEQGKNLPQVSQTLQEANDLSNDMFKSNIAKFAPNLESTNQQIGANAEDLLSGKVPIHGATTGYGGQPLSARDLGLTSDDLMTSGVGMAGSALTGARALNPFEHDSTSLLLSPGALLSRDDAHQYQANDIENQQAQIKAKADSINPLLSGLTGAAGTLGSLFKSQRSTSVGGGF